MMDRAGLSLHLLHLSKGDVTAHAHTTMVLACRQAPALTPKGRDSKVLPSEKEHCVSNAKG